MQSLPTRLALYSACSVAAKPQIRYLNWKIHTYDDLISFVRHLIRWLITNAGCLGKMLTQALAFITYPQKYDVSIDFLEGLDCYWKQRAALQNISSWIFMQLSISNCNSFSGCQRWQYWVYLTQITPNLSFQQVFSALSCFLSWVSLMVTGRWIKQYFYSLTRSLTHFFIPSHFIRCVRCWRRSWRSSRRSSTWPSCWGRQKRELPTRWWRYRSVSAWTSSHRRSDARSASSAWDSRWGDCNASREGQKGDDNETDNYYYHQLQNSIIKFYAPWYFLWVKYYTFYSTAFIWQL